MIHAKKKVVVNKSSAQQTAQIIANVKLLIQKKLISFNQNEVFFYIELWKDEKMALNWMKCIHIYCIIKKITLTGNTLNFKNIINNETVGTITNGKPKILIAF